MSSENAEAVSKQPNAETVSNQPKKNKPKPIGEAVEDMKTQYTHWTNNYYDIRAILLCFKTYCTEANRDLDQEDESCLTEWFQAFSNVGNVLTLLHDNDDIRLRAQRCLPQKDTIQRGILETADTALKFQYRSKDKARLNLLSFERFKRREKQSYTFSDYERKNLLVDGGVTKIPWKFYDIALQTFLMCAAFMRMCYLYTKDEDGRYNYYSVDESMVFLSYSISFLWGLLQESKHLFSYHDRVYGMIPLFRRALCMTMVSHLVVVTETIRFLWFYDEPLYVLVLYLVVALMFIRWHNLKLEIEKEIMILKDNDKMRCFNRRQTSLYIPSIYEGLSTQVPEHSLLPFWHLCARTQAAKAMFNFSNFDLSTLLWPFLELVARTVVICLVVSTIMACGRGICKWILWICPMSGMVANLVLWTAIIICIVVAMFVSIIARPTIDTRCLMGALLMAAALLNQDRHHIVKYDEQISYLQDLKGVYVVQGGKVEFKPDILPGNKCYAVFTPDEKLVTTNSPSILMEMLKYHGHPDFYVSKCNETTCESRSVGKYLPDIQYHARPLITDAAIVPVSDYTHFCSDEYVKGKKIDTDLISASSVENTLNDLHLFTSVFKKDFPNFIQNTVFYWPLFGIGNMLCKELILKVVEIIVESVWTQAKKLPEDMSSLMGF